MFVIKCLRRLWVFGVVVRLDSDNGCVVLHQVGISLYFTYSLFFMPSSVHF